jgi:Domain of unknown function (DUF6089)
MKAQFIMLFVLIVAVQNLFAQFYKDMSIGVNAGAYIYQGDLTPQRFGSFKTPSFGLGIAIKKPINYFLSARLNMAFTKLKGDESKYKSPDWRQLRNFSFTAPVKEFTALLQWNILGRNYDERGFMPYIFGGAGISFVKIKPDYNRMDATLFGEGSDVANGLAQDITHGTPRRTFTVPVGLGVEKYISDRFSLSLETAYRFVFTDYLDGFSQAANPKLNDHYHSTSVGIIYKFGKKDKGIGCPVMKY